MLLKVYWFCNIIINLDTRDGYPNSNELREIF